MNKIRLLIGAFAALGLSNSGLATMPEMPSVPKSDLGNPINSNKSADGTFTDSKGRRYRQDEKGTIRRIKD